MIGLSFREQLPPIVAAELDALMARLKRLLDSTTSASTVAANLTGLTSRIAAAEASLVGLTGDKAPASSTYITQTPDAGLGGEQALSALATGVMKSTTGTGVVSIATAGDIPFASDTPGLKHARVTTGAVAGGATALITITWATAFSSTNYTVVAQVEDATAAVASLTVVHVESKSTADCKVRVTNAAAGALTGTVHAIAIKD